MEDVAGLEVASIFAGVRTGCGAVAEYLDQRSWSRLTRVNVIIPVLPPLRDRAGWAARLDGPVIYPS
jgi:hypothetical protein